MSDSNLNSKEPEQWSKERLFFDAKALEAGSFPLELVEARYTKSKARPLYPLEVAYSALGEISGKRVLDVGCGNGENSLLFAKWGARVTGVDISAGAINLCKERARQAGLEPLTTFRETPFERLVESDEQYDIVWSAAFLHHVLDRLPEVTDLLSRLVAPGGFVLFYEPVRFSSVLKTVRRVIPPFPEATPDERPLEKADLHKLEVRFEVADPVYFGPVSRIVERWVMTDAYETASARRRDLSDSLSAFDKWLMQTTIANAFAMVMVAKLLPRSSESS